MAKNTKEEHERLNLFIPPNLAADFNAYCLVVVNKKGKIPRAIKPKIALEALKLWLEKNKDNPQAYDEIMEE